jgi:hypothetical protein
MQTQNMLKRCTKCGEVRTLDKFTRDKTKSGGLYPSCRRCAKEYCDATREARNARGGAYREANREMLNARSKAWRKANRDIVNARVAARYAENRDTVIAKRRAHRKTTQEVNIAYLASIHPLKCHTCGFDRCFAALDFHHTDPGQKDSKDDSMGRWITLSLRSFKAKIQSTNYKILCSNCHRELHAEDPEILARVLKDEWGIKDE